MDRVAERAHRNLCDYTRWNGRLDPATETLDGSGIVAIAGSVDFPTARTALRSDRTLPTEQWAETVDKFYADRGKTAFVYTRVGADDDLTEQLLLRGFREWTTTPEMVCDTELEARDPRPA